LLVSCNIDKKRNICNTNIKNIEVFYYNQLITTYVAINCDYLIKQVHESKTNIDNIIYLSVIDTLITDCYTIEQIENEIKIFNL